MKYLFLLASLFLLTACNDKTSNLKDGLYAIIETNKGDIIVELFYDKTPITVSNFITLAEGKNDQVTLADKKGKPFYNGLKFHRVMNNFMIQGGCPVGDGSGGPGYSFLDETIQDLKHNKAGVLSMANSDNPNAKTPFVNTGKSNGSQFYITHVETPWLDGFHTVFGEVVEGMPIVNQIVQGDEIISINIVRKGEKAKKFDAVAEFNKRLVKEAEAKAVAEQKRKEQLASIQSVIDDKLVSFEILKSTAKKTASGLQYAVIKKGSGKKPAAGTQVYINYAGYFSDGVLFDTGFADVAKAYNMYDENRAAQKGYDPFVFQYGQKMGLIPGFIEGIEQMSFGDKFLLYIPSHLGYGEAGMGEAIKPNTDLIFEIEMTETIQN